jgi:hypothetical protein
MNQPDGFIDPHGGFRELKSYQMSEIVYDATAAFCDRWISRRSRTHDQMVQAARSGKQNIAEGSMASGIQKDRRCLNVAKAGGLQSQGVKGEVVVVYRNPLTTQDLKSSGFPAG